MVKCSVNNYGPVSIEVLVSEYIKNQKKNFENCLKQSSNKENLFNHPHQHNVRKTAKQEATVCIEKDGLWEKSYNSFEEVYNAVKDSIGKIPFIGELTVYDVALRIAYSKKIYPKNAVYLCRGSKEGFINLLKKLLKIVVDVALRKLLEKLLDKVLHIDFFILTSDLIKILIEYFPALKELMPMYLEDFFCVMRNEISKLKV